VTTDDELDEEDELEELDDELEEDEDEPDDGTDELEVLERDGRDVVGPSSAATVVVGVGSGVLGAYAGSSGFPHLQRVTGWPASGGVVVAVLGVPDVSEPGVVLLELEDEDDVDEDEEVDSSVMPRRIGFASKFASTSTAVPAARLDGLA
jgi:hypothetical protein